MGQAWCKEKTNKAQDSKSPLDRVFVRCAHRIYPSLKEEGSVLGGATQRVTSSEIGYAGSPPRDVLTRGRSIDSVDRPFHPSEWVDVNLEVPSTPRASSVLTNMTVDTSLYPATTPTSSCSNLKDVTPVPPPRRRKKNRGRPLPPKPDEIPENGGNLKRVDTSDEPLYSSVKSPKLDNDNVAEVEGKEQQQQQQQQQQQRQEEQQQQQKGKTSAQDEDPKQDGRRAKEIYEHKVNGTGRIIPSDVVSGNKRPPGPERKSSRNGESSVAGTPIRKVPEDEEEYERFARSQSIKDSSTPNRQEGRKPRELEKRVNDHPAAGEQRPEANGRPKNYSTVSLPNYDELDVARHHRQRGPKGHRPDEDRKPRRPVRSSTGSLPVESALSPFSQKTSVLLEDYVPRRGSSEHLLPYQVLGKLGRSGNGVDDGGFVKYDPSKLEDWDLSDIGNCELNHRQCSFEDTAPRIIGEKVAGDRGSTGGEDVVDFASKGVETGENEAARRQANSSNIDAGSIQQASLSLQKPDAFGKSAGEQDGGVVSKDVDEWVVGQHRSLRYFDPPTLDDCKCSPDTGSSGAVCREPFFLNEDAQAKANDTIGGSCRNGAVEEPERSPGLPTSRTIFERSLSNESEPYEDNYESKDLRDRSSPIAGNLIRTISEESLPREILDEVEIVDGMTNDDFFDEKLAKDAHNKLTKDCADQKVIVKTPPPSPEPKIKAEILDNDHSTLLKVLKEEAHEGSNLSSMTPSLTELEAALSDMLEKEEPSEEVKDDDVTKRASISPSTERPIEPSILPTGNSVFLKKVDEVIDSDRNLVDESGKTKSMDKLPISLEQILEDVRPVAKTRKVSFCAWEESAMEEVDLRNGQDGDGFGDGEEFFARTSSADKVAGSMSGLLMDEAPEKPSRLHRSSMEGSTKIVENIPTPPRRRHKNVGRESLGELEAKDTDPYPTDRLI